MLSVSAMGNVHFVIFIVVLTDRWTDDVLDIENYKNWKSDMEM